MYAVEVTDRVAIIYSSNTQLIHLPHAFDLVYTAVRPYIMINNRLTFGHRISYRVR